MIPSVLATQFREGLCDYMLASFPVTSPLFGETLKDFLARDEAFFHAPWLSVRLPFRSSAEEEGHFETVHSPYLPYIHQTRAWDRLCGQAPKSTLVATGTGSGKTECFLWPILEYCYRHKGEPGIKAILIYPMNALANDQATRVAQLIFDSPQLRGNVTAGMYVGGQGEHESRTMQEEKVITDHEILRLCPPDILITNYKMLDLLMVRPRDSELWSENGEPGTLRFLVVDELHTYDGAQGTDLVLPDTAA